MIKIEYHPYENKEKAIEALSIVTQLLARLSYVEAGGSDELLELRHLQRMYKGHGATYGRDNDLKTTMTLVEQKEKTCQEIDSKKAELLDEKKKVPETKDALKQSNLPVYASLCRLCEQKTCFHGRLDEKEGVGMPCVDCVRVCCSHELFDEKTKVKRLRGMPDFLLQAYAPANAAPPAMVTAVKKEGVPTGAVHHAMAPVELEFWDMRCMFEEGLENDKYADALDSFFRFFTDKMVVEKVAGSRFLFTVTLTRSEFRQLDSRMPPTCKIYNVVGHPLDVDKDSDWAILQEIRKTFCEKYAVAPQTEEEVVQMFRMIFGAEAYCLTGHFFKVGQVVY